MRMSQSEAQAVMDSGAKGIRRGNARKALEFYALSPAEQAVIDARPIGIGQPWSENTSSPRDSFGELLGKDAR